ncbi:unnamed protein product [Bursaphelenchus okinawaensis]|uniref:Seven TM Receptor n=1 Tax=Bursaphelenchus okinawaensis TaxID=465554 RepID=A0A811LQU9_9BILA|nr:unnamed protein product [Bursaphelenchus okinawaensis]CAG9127891.1 unnamed protein product [Bursaphelenchus okinawaensis]
MCGDFIYTGINLVTMMVVEVKGGIIYFMTMGIFQHSPYPLNMIMGCLWLMAMYVTILTLGMQFIYRYYALCKTALTPAWFIFYYCIGLSVCFCDGFVGLFIADGNTEYYTNLIKEHPMYTNDTPGYMVIDPANLPALLHTMMSQCIVVSTYVVIFYTGGKINQKLNEASGSMSASTKDAQKQLNRVMILQAFYPAVIAALPIIVATVLAQFKFDTLWCGFYLAPSISLIPIANSVTILFVIPSFRRRIVNYAAWKINKVATTVTWKPYSTTQSKFYSNEENEESNTQKSNYEHLI